MDILTFKDFLTMGAALVGAVLGIMNTWNAMNQKRVHLRIVPAYLLDTQANPIGFSIEVTNLSTFPVTVSEVGVTLPGKQRFVIRNPEFLDQGAWPRRLEARAAFSAILDPGELAGLGGKLRKAYVRTACGEYRYGVSKALRQLDTLLPK